MRVDKAAEHALRLTVLHEPGVPAEPAVDPVELMICALAQCTWKVLAGYGERIGVGAEDVVITARWRFEERPRRISSVSMDIRWPALPDSRLDAATRAARHCTVHTTLSHGAEVDVLVDH